MESTDTPGTSHPQPASSSRRFIIHLPYYGDEIESEHLQVQIIAGCYLAGEDDETYVLSGRIYETPNVSWEAYHFVVDVGGPVPTRNTPMARPRGGFVPVQSSPVVRYRSRVPIVVLCPAHVEVRYRVWATEKGRAALAKGPSQPPAVEHTVPPAVEHTVPPAAEHTVPPAAEHTAEHTAEHVAPQQAEEAAYPTMESPELPRENEVDSREEAPPHAYPAEPENVAPVESAMEYEEPVEVAPQGRSPTERVYPTDQPPQAQGAPIEEYRPEVSKRQSKAGTRDLEENQIANRQETRKPASTVVPLSSTEESPPKHRGSRSGAGSPGHLSGEASPGANGGGATDHASTPGSGKHKGGASRKSHDLSSNKYKEL